MKYIERDTYRGSTEIVICQTEIPYPQAQLAIDLMKQLAIATACPDGEDSSGRQKLRLLTPEEVVARASAIADLAWKEYRKREWIMDIPLPKLDKPLKLEPSKQEQ